MTAFIAAYPELAGVLGAIAASALILFVLSFRWASRPTIIRPDDGEIIDDCIITITQLSERRQ